MSYLRIEEGERHSTESLLAPEYSVCGPGQVIPDTGFHSREKVLVNKKLNFTSWETWATVSNWPRWLIPPISGCGRGGDPFHGAVTSSPGPLSRMLLSSNCVCQ